MTSVICGRKSIGETSEYKEVGQRAAKTTFFFSPRGDCREPCAGLSSPRGLAVGYGQRGECAEL